MAPPERSMTRAAGYKKGALLHNLAKSLNWLGGDLRASSVTC